MAWDSRRGLDYDNHAYAAAYEDDYYGVKLNPDEEELLVQRALDRIRIARSRGQPNRQRQQQQSLQEVNFEAFNLLFLAAIISHPLWEIGQ
ncbi:hypothetical protein SLS57_000014 [Botryosphaeria dothidea]